ncbi:hypothetical protein JCM5353_002878 [Sporobolomyces roseus]
MLRHALSRACRCTSTSTSLPCKHATIHRSYSRKTPPNSAPSTISTSSSYSFQPHVLVNHTGPNKGKESRWFEPLQTNTFKDWPLPAPPPPPTTSSSSSSAQEQVTSYLMTRGPRERLYGKFEDEYGELLEIAKKNEMPFLKALVLEDLGFKEMSNGERSKLGLERFEKRGGKEREEAIIKEVKGLSEVVDFKGANEVVEPQQLQGRKRTSEKEAAMAQTPTETIQDLPPDSSLSSSQALCLLSELIDPSHLSPSLTPTQISQLWSHIQPSLDLSSSLSDFRTTLSLLHQVLSVSHPTPNLPLAFEIFSSLVQVLPEHLISPQPSSIPDNLAIQFVLLRTALQAALSEDLYTLAIEISLTLGKLHESVIREEVGRKEDLMNLGRAVQGVLSELREERKGSYKPSELEISQSGELERVEKALEIMKELIGSACSVAGEADGKILEQMKCLVNEFMEEASERYRWDLVARNFKPWYLYFDTPDSPIQWEGLGRNHLKLARWLSGTAPYSTYPQQLSHSESRRPALPELFSFFARITHLQLRQGSLSSQWTLEEKWHYLDLLLVSPGSTRETRSLARRIVSYWMSSSSPLVPSTRNPFTLRSTTLLHLLRSSTSQSKTHPSGEEFSKSLINHFIQSLISPLSPYSTPSSSSTIQLQHFDLTTLAQAYTILGDSESVGQVYRKMLSLKYLPDERDVRLILENRGGDGDGGVGFLRDVMQKVGVKVGVNTLKGLLKGVMERGEEEKVRGVMRFVREESGIRVRELKGLEEFVKREWEGPRMTTRQLGQLSMRELETLLEGESSGLSVKKAMGYLKKALKTRDYGLSLKIYHIFLHSPTSSSSSSSSTTSSLSPLYNTTLSTLLSSLQRSKSSLRPTILDAVAQTIDQTLSLSPRTISSSQENVELTLRALIKVGEVGAVEKMFEMDEFESEGVGREMREVVVRWAVGREGRESCGSREGVVGEWAREVLREK